MELEQMLKNVGWQITDNGIDEATARQVADVARRLQVADVATTVFADPQAPYAARCRAFAVVAGAIRQAIDARPTFTLAA